MTNKEIVLNFYRDVWNAHDPSKVADYVHEDYIQHNPTVEQGREGLLKFLDFFFKKEARRCLFSAEGPRPGFPRPWFQKMSPTHSRKSGRFRTRNTANPPTDSGNPPKRTDWSG